MSRSATDLALVVSAKSHGERGAIVTLFSSEFGVVRGLVTVTKQNQGLLVVGNTVRYEHFKRLPHQLGKLTLEAVTIRSAAMIDGVRGALVAGWLSELLGELLPEEHPYPVLYAMVENFLDGFRHGDVGSLWRRAVVLELRLLREIGYGLSLDAEGAVPCDSGTPLTYVSPKSGRAVSAAMGAPYARQMLLLPHVFGGPACNEDEDITRALRLTGTFLQVAGHGVKLPARGRFAGWLCDNVKTTEVGRGTKDMDVGGIVDGQWRIAS